MHTGQQVTLCAAIEKQVGESWQGINSVIDTPLAQAHREIWFIPSHISSSAVRITFKLAMEILGRSDIPLKDSHGIPLNLLRRTASRLVQSAGSWEKTLSSQDVTTVWTFVRWLLG